VPQATKIAVDILLIITSV